MTIRDYIKRRAQWALGVAFVCWLLFTFNGKMGNLGPRADFFPFIPIITFFGFWGAMLALLFIRCPKCRAPLGQTIAIPTALRLIGPQVKHCPFCAACLDENMPGTVSDDLGR